MNEKLKGLADKAGFFVYDGTIMSPFKDESDISDLLEKFAKLIVSEMGDIKNELSQFDATEAFGDGYECGLKDLLESVTEELGVAL